MSRNRQVAERMGKVHLPWLAWDDWKRRDVGDEIVL